MIEYLLYCVVGGVLYRLGGKEGFDTKFRDIGVPLLSIFMLFRLGTISGFWQWISMIPCFLTTMGALSTYRYFLPKPKDYEWYHYAMHGFFVALGMIFYAWATSKWLGIAERAILTSALMGGWYFIGKVNDDLHEFGRGFIVLSTLGLLF